METFVYSCPGCGAKVEFNENTRLWECSYCDNVYEAIFENDDNTLPKIVDKNYIIYKYNCDKCNNSFLSILEKDGLCNSCNTIIKKNGEPIHVHNVIESNVTRGTAAYSYNHTLSDISDDLYNDYNDNSFKLTYYEFDSYQGVIKFTYGNVTKKYIFADLFIPNIDYEDYRFLYEVSKIKVKASCNLNNKDVDLMPLTKNPYNSNTINNINQKILDEDTIVEMCKNHFIVKNHIKDQENIIVEKSISHNEGNYIPVYVMEHEKDGVIYREYQFGNYSFYKYDSAITEFDDTTIDKEIFSCKLTKMASFIVFPIIFAALAPLYLGKEYNIIIILIVMAIFYFSIVVRFYFGKKDKKIKKLESSRLITREEYINNLINRQIKVIDNRNKR
jgi:DNA-directed RNA polymerase subunit RPC12/RpoP